MGALVKIVVFLVGLAGLLLTGANAASAMGIDVGAHLDKMGAVGGVAHCAVTTFGGWLAHGSALIAGAPADAAAKPSLLAQWGPYLISALVSGLLMAGSSRQ